MRTIRFAACVAVLAWAPAAGAQVDQRAEREARAAARMLHELHTIQQAIEQRQAEVEAARADAVVMALQAQGHEVSLRSQLEALAAQSHRARATDGAAWHTALDALARAAAPPPHVPQDPAETLWRTGREQLNRGDVERAAESFRRIRTDPAFSRSAYRAEAHYWEAFALSRVGTDDALRRARETLVAMRDQHPGDARVRDADALLATIDGRLARSGDPLAMQLTRTRLGQSAVTLRAQPPAQTAPQAAPPPAGVWPAQAPSPVAWAGTVRPPAHCEPNAEDDVRMAALGALAQVDATAALPALRRILADRREECAIGLRQRAVLVAAQVRSPDAVELLADAAGGDPSPQVRGQAVALLAHINSEAALDALEAVLRSADDAQLRRHAATALAQHRSPRSAEILRRFATREDVPADIRSAVITSLAVHRDAGQRAFLRSLYRQVTDQALRDQILNAVAMRRDEETAQWLFDIAFDEREPAARRQRALGLAGQNRTVPVDRVVQLYDRVSGRDFKLHVITALAARNEPAAVDKLMDIARGDADTELRKQAITRLGRSRDPRVAQFLVDILR